MIVTDVELHTAEIHKHVKAFSTLNPMFIPHLSKFPYLILLLLVCNVSMNGLGKERMMIVFPAHLSFHNETFFPFRTTKLIQFRMDVAVSSPGFMTETILLTNNLFHLS